MNDEIRIAALAMIKAADQHVDKMRAGLSKIINSEADAPRVILSSSSWFDLRDRLDELCQAMQHDDPLTAAARHFLLVMKEPIPGYRNQEEQAVAAAQLERRSEAWARLAALVGAEERRRS